MWRSGPPPGNPQTEPVSIEEARAHLCIDGDQALDLKIQGLIRTARAHAELYCNQLFSPRQLTLQCDCFTDLARFPVAPVHGIISIKYVAPDGTGQPLDLAGCDIRAPGMDTAILLKGGAIWPLQQRDSSITVIVKAGHDATPDDVKHAMLLLIGSWFIGSESAPSGSFSTVDALLSNHRWGW